MKKFITLLFLLALGAGFLFVGWQFAGATAQATAPTPTPPPSPTITSTTAPACVVSTGIDNGTVNLRACPGLACGAVLDILTEGASLTIVSTGEYFNVTTKSGVTGWLNKKYCKANP